MWDRLCRNPEVPFEWLTYEQVSILIYFLTQAFEEKIGLKKGDFVGICANNQLMWYLIDIAALILGCTVVPIHHALDENTRAYIMGHSKCKVVFATPDQVPSIAKSASLMDTQCVEKIISFNGPFDASNLPLSPGDFQIVDLSSILDVAALIEKTKQDLSQFEEIKPEIVSYLSSRASAIEPQEYATIVYTSGSTGVPKAIGFTFDLWFHGIRIEYRPTSNLEVSFSKDSLAHISDRESVHSTLLRGGQIGITSGHHRILEDITVLEPTDISSTPRFWELYHAKFKSQYELRLSEFRSSVSPSMGVVERAKAEDQIRLQTLAVIKEMLGSRIRSVVTGGAATPLHLKEFLDECFGSMVSEGFACSEVGPVTNEGTVMNDITFKLVDVPDLGYTSKSVHLTLFFLSFLVSGC